MIIYHYVRCDKVLTGEDVVSLVVCPVCCNDSRWDEDENFMVAGYCTLSLSEGVLMIAGSTEKEL